MANERTFLSCLRLSIDSPCIRWHRHISPLFGSWHTAVMINFSLSPSGSGIELKYHYPIGILAEDSGRLFTDLTSRSNKLFQNNSIIWPTQSSCPSRIQNSIHRCPLGCFIISVAIVFIVTRAGTCGKHHLVKSTTSHTRRQMSRSTCTNVLNVTELPNPQQQPSEVPNQSTALRNSNANLTFHH